VRGGRGNTFQRSGQIGWRKGKDRSFTVVYPVAVYGRREMDGRVQNSEGHLSFEKTKGFENSRNLKKCRGEGDDRNPKIHIRVWSCDDRF